MTIDFSERWWVGKNVPIDSIDAEAARHRHTHHQPYVAIIGGNNSPHCVVEFADEWISVIFLDGEHRQYLRYDFQMKDSERLFLKMAYYWEYGNGSDAPTSTKLFSFNEDGHILMEYRDSMSGDVKNLETVASLTENWERYPSFGEYDLLCNKTRRNKPVA